MKLSAIYLDERVIDTDRTRDHFKALREKYGISQKMTATHMQISQQYLCDLEAGHRTWNKELVKKFISAMNNCIEGGGVRIPECPSGQPTCMGGLHGKRGKA